MKRTGILSLVFSLVTSTAFAAEANRADVERARANGEQLSKTERLSLQSQVVLAEILRSQFILAQKPMNLVGIEHKRGPVTFTLGVSQALAEIMLGSLAATKLTAVRFGQVDRSITSKYEDIAKERAHVQQVRADADAIRAQEATLKAEARAKALAYESSEETLAKLTKLEQNIADREALIASYGESVTRLGRDSKWFEKIGRPTRLVLGAAIMPIVVIEGTISFLAVSIPDQGDETIQNLTDFIDDARATLDAR